MRARLACVLAVGAAASALSACSGSDEETARCVDAVASRAASDVRPTLHGVAREVERLRRLRFRRIPEPRYLRRRALERRLRAEIDRYPAAELTADERALVALGAVPSGTNLQALLRRAVPSQIAGFYDPQTGELVVLSDARRALDGLERVTLAHELVHALADQTLEFPSYLEAHWPPEGREDAVAAGLALIEGDAMLVTDAYAVEHLSVRDALSAGAAFAASDQAEQLPYYLRASMLFPYEQGLPFVCRVFSRGGWRAVDRAYRRPPTSTAQVLFPERYFRRERPVDPPDPPFPGRGWKRLDRAAFGAADLLWLFEAPGGKPSRALPSARRRAAAWAGGELSVWARGKKTTVTLTLAERRGAPDLCGSLRRWARAASRPGAVVRCSGRIARATLRSAGERRRR